MTTTLKVCERSVSSRRHISIRGSGNHVLADGEDIEKGMRGSVFEFGRLSGIVGEVCLWVGGRPIELGGIFHVGPNDKVTAESVTEFQLFFIEGHQ